MLCAKELESMLQCFAATGDLRHQAGCAEAAQKLAKCMAVAPTTRAKPRSGTINYLLSKVKK